MSTYLYHSPAWRKLRALALERDGNRCTLGRLFGGGCSSTLIAHHIIPITDGGPEVPDLDGVLTVCSSHHPKLHAFRRAMLEHREPVWKTCTHHHPYPQGRLECERRLNRVAA
jgi:hypothetical protein